MRKIVYFLAIVLFLTGCKKSAVEPDEVKSELQDNVILIKEETKDKIINFNGNTLIVKGIDGYAKGVVSTQDEFKIGTVIVCEPIPNVAPDGILGRVIDIQQNTDPLYGAGYNNLTLAPAGLDEYIKNVERAYEKKEFIAEEVERESGVSATINSTSVSITIDKMIQQNFGAQASVNFKVTGSLKFEKDINLGLEVKDSKFKYFKFEIVNKDIADLKVEGNFELASKKEWTLCKIKGKRIIFSIGGIPVWVKPIFTVKFIIDASGKAGFKIDVIKFEKEYSNGIEYSNGSWKNIEIVKPTSFTPLEYQLYLEGQAKLSLEADYEGSFYNGLVSCGVNISLYRKIINRIQSGEPTKCDWILGADLGLFVKSSIFSKELLDYQLPLFTCVFKSEIINLLTTSPPPPPDIVNGLIAHYTLNGNTNDVSGNNRNLLQYYDVTPCPDRKGNPNKSYRFAGDGLLSYTNANGFASFQNGLTVSYWVKGENFANADFALVSLYTAPSNNMPLFSVRYRILSSPNSNYFLNKIFCDWGQAYNLNTDYQENNYSNSYGNWHQWVVTLGKDNKIKRWYDGTLVSDMSDSNTSSFLNSFTNLATIAFGWSNHTTERFSGYLDDVRIYNRTLTNSDVTAIYNLEK